MSLGSPTLMTSTRDCLAPISQQSFQRTESGEGIPAWEHKKLLLSLAASLLLLSNPVQLPKQMHFCLFTSRLFCLPSSSVWHSSGHLSIPFPLLQLTQKWCAFYQQRNINTFVLWFFPCLAKYISAIAPDGLYCRRSSRGKKVTILLPNSSV